MGSYFTAAASHAIVKPKSRGCYDFEVCWKYCHHEL